MQSKFAWTTVLTLFVASAAPSVLIGQDADVERRVEETVREAGILESAAATDIRVGVSSSILMLAPAGQQVKKGDLLVRLDTSSLEDALNEQRVLVAGAKAQLIEAKAAVDAARVEGKGGLLVAEMAVKVADLEFQRLTGKGGELELRKMEAETELAVARKRVKTAEQIQQLATAKARAADGELSPATELAVSEAKAKLAVAEGRKKWLDEHVTGHETAALRLASLEAELELTRARHRSERQIAQAEAALAATEAALELELAKLERVERQLESCQIVAPRDGVVLHANRSASRAGRNIVIEQGANVREGQTILQLVDMTRLQLQVRVHESRINRVRVGQSAVVRFDALPDRPVQGRVVRVGRVPLPTNWFEDGGKEYSALVSIDEPPAGLKLGLTAMAEINVAGAGAGADADDNEDAPRRGGRGGDLRSLDKNGDGKVTKDEAPGALKGIFDRIDRNKDGAIDDKEVEAIRNRFLQRQPRD